MAHLVHRPLRGFRTSPDQIWLLEWFGGLIENPQDPTNPLIECVLTSCRENPQWHKGFSRNPRRQEIRHVGACALPGIELGRRFDDGRLDPFQVVSAKAEERITFRFHPASAREVMLSDLQIDRATTPFGEMAAALEMDSAVKYVAGHMLASDDSRFDAVTARSPVALSVILPELEIIRFYYLISNRLAMAIFNGWFETDRLGKIVLSKHEGPHIRISPNGQKIARLEHRLGWSEEDVKIVARTLFSECALRGARRVSRLIEVGRLSGSRRYYPRTLFPFDEEVEVELAGRRVHLGDDSFAFLAYRITSCTSSMPFDAISYQCEVQPGGVPAPPGAPIAFPAGKPRPTPDTREPKGDIIDSPAAENSEPAVSVPEPRIFRGMEDVEVRREKERENTHRSDHDKRRGNDGRKLPDSSAGGTTTGQTTAQKQGVEDEIDGATVSPDLRQFVDVLRELAKSTGWRVRSVPVGGHWRDRDLDVYFSSFPEVPCPRMRSEMRQFSYIDAEKTALRRLVCASVAASGRWAYILEAERRKNDKGADMEQLPILVIWNAHRAPIPTEVIVSVLIATANNPSKTWPRDLSWTGLERVAVDHVLKARDDNSRIAEGAKRLTRKLRRVFGVDPSGAEPRSE